MDLPGTALFMCALVCLILALQWGGATKPWGSGDVIGTLVGFGVIIIAFIAWEIYQDERALLVPRLLKQKSTILLASFQIFGSAAFMLFMVSCTSISSLKHALTSMKYYLPIYFQVVSDVTAAQSGIRNLPFILGICLFTIVSGMTIMVTGHFIPLMIIGSTLSTLGSGLLYTLDIGTPTGKWIGYQIVAGIGFGLVIQIPIIVSQAISKPADLSSITAIIIFFQTLGFTIFVSMGQTLFTNQLVTSAPKYVPGIDVNLMVSTGATDIRKVFPADQVAGIVHAYMDGLKNAYAMSIAVAGTSFIIAMCVLLFDRRRLNQDETKNATGAA